MADRKRVLILSRKYPPSTGGMQAYTKNFVRCMENAYDVEKIVLGKGQINLIWFLPYLFFKASILLMTKKYDFVWLCDGLLAPLGVVFKKLFSAKVAITVHGLDITYANKLYQGIVPGSIARLDKVVCVSRSTLAECEKRGIPEEKCAVITNGIEEKEFESGLSKEELLKGLERSFGSDLSGKKILVTVGRLIKRKGVTWFTENVMSQLDPDYVYFVAGEGPEKDNIIKSLEERGLADRVKVLGKISFDDLKLLYNSAHALVIPNQKIGDDTEGFGIVAIEAASCGLPAVANAIDGLREAVLNGKTGWLIEYNNVGQFVDKIKNTGLDRLSVKDESKVFSWENIIGQYQKVINEI